MAGLCSLDDYRRAAAAGDVLPDALLRKQYPAQVKAEGGEREVAFTISTGAVDRQNDTISVDGWELDNFRRAGAILWAHRADELPIAKPTFVDAKGGALKARAVFEPGVYALSDLVYTMLMRGWLRATSVGFRPLEYAINEERGGLDFLKQELLEFSVVPIPANPEALMEAKAAGVDLSPLKDWAERALADVDGPGLWVPKDVAARALKIASGQPSSVVVPTDAAGAGPSGSHAPASLGATPGAATKAGRVLSRANEDRIRAAHEALGAVLTQIQQDDDSADDSGAGKAVPATTPPPTTRRESRPSINLDVVRAVAVNATREALREAMGRLPD